MGVISLDLKKAKQEAEIRTLCCSFHKLYLLILDECVLPW